MRKINNILEKPTAELKKFFLGNNYSTEELLEVIERLVVIVNQFKESSISIEKQEPELSEALDFIFAERDYVLLKNLILECAGKHLTDELTMIFQEIKLHVFSNRDEQLINMVKSLDHTIVAYPLENEPDQLKTFWNEIGKFGFYNDVLQLT